MPEEAKEFSIDDFLEQNQHTTYNTASERAEEILSNYGATTITVSNLHRWIANEAQDLFRENAEKGSNKPVLPHFDLEESEHYDDYHNLIDREKKIEALGIAITLLETAGFKPRAFSLEKQFKDQKYLNQAYERMKTYISGQKLADRYIGNLDPTGETLEKAMEVMVGEARHACLDGMNAFLLTANAYMQEGNKEKFTYWLRKATATARQLQFSEKGDLNLLSEKADEAYFLARGDRHRDFDFEAGLRDKYELVQDGLSYSEVIDSLNNPDFSAREYSLLENKKLRGDGTDKVIDNSMIYRGLDKKKSFSLWVLKEEYVQKKTGK